ncbi:MAG TPA: glutamine amidotransferase [Noviherbaspirillum sp.]|nr:glutamine amidotransferase [Noviherbaspirillum sp.]HJV85347.1 glutamine amidotransferase [Noviherbaspirillum sp.]
MHCLAIRHVAFEDLGTFGPVLQETGFTIGYAQAGVDRLSPGEWDAADLVVVLGGPIGVNDQALYPFLAEEIALINARLAQGKPLLGICLGAQMIAAALGARVYPGRAKEIGWGDVVLTEAGHISALSVLEGAPVLHWHGDTFDLPQGATLLASTSVAPHQAFSLGKNVLALQFHPEADAARMDEWLVGHACELAYAGVDPRVIRADAEKHGAAAARGATAMLRTWLRDAGLMS